MPVCLTPFGLVGIRILSPPSKKRAPSITKREDHSKKNCAHYWNRTLWYRLELLSRRDTRELHLEDGEGMPTVIFSYRSKMRPKTVRDGNVALYE